MKLGILSVLVFVASCSRSDNVVNNDTPPETAKPGYAVIEGQNGLKFHTGLLKSKDLTKSENKKYVSLGDCENLPEEFDLRTLGLVSEIRNQGNCGSCWAFSKTNSLESALLGMGKKVDLAEQELVSCDRQQYGCEGGNLTGFSYQINHGQSLEKDFPYTSGRSGRDGACKNVDVAEKGASFQYVGASNRSATVKELKCALFKFKTVPWITVSATNAWGNPPSSEKRAYTRCGRGETNHAVGVVGWWTDGNKKTQFVMKNSWGMGWGDKGYMSLPLGCDSFGEEIAFIQLAK